MTEGGGEERTLVACVACGKAYAAEELSDGRIVPISRHDGCSCGGSEFDEIEADEAFSYDEDAVGEDPG